MANIKNLKPFKPGQTGNPAGRPRKLISQVNLDLENQGYSEVKRQDIVSCYLRLVNLPFAEIQKLVDDSTQPALVSIAGKALLSGKGFEVIEQLLDRVIGKASNQISVSTEPTWVDIIRNLNEDDRRL